MKLKFTLLCLFISGISIAQSLQNLININPDGSAFEAEASQILATDDFLYFYANDGIHGVELWKSDGTETGTQLIKDINSGVEDVFDDSYNSFIECAIFEVGDHIIFLADDEDHGLELWKTDGTEEGTDILLDIYPGPTNGIPLTTDFGAFVMDDILFFQGKNEEFGAELWRTDGTVAGTYMVKNIRYLSADSNPHEFLEFNDLLYFNGNEGFIQGGLGQELYVTDGTEEGTFMVKDIDEGFGSSDPRSLALAGDFFYFIADDGLESGLWKSDGTDAGTTLIKDGIDYIIEVKAVGSRLYFSAGDEINGLELWTSDGTTEGTVLVKDINVGISGSSPKRFAALNDKLYFIAESEPFSDNLWVSDGTEAGTMKVVEGDANYPTVFNNEIIFEGPSPSSSFKHNLWRSDGTTAGTERIVMPTSNIEISFPHDYISFQNKLYFVAFDEDSDRELWVYEPEEGSSVSNLGKADNFSISPNPTDQFITLDFADFNKKTLTIYNTQGQQVLKRENINNQAISINTNEFQSGVYYAEVINQKNQKRTKRFAVK